MENRGFLEVPGARSMAFGPDGKLYIPVGAPCNVCESEDPRFASITRMNPDGSGFEIFAHGVRNTVGFDWNPADQVLWFTDNGRDRMGDDVPPDEHPPQKILQLASPLLGSGPSTFKGGLYAE